jgi:hypothetical protein
VTILPKSGAKDDADSEIDDVAAHRETAKLFPHSCSSFLSVSLRVFCLKRQSIQAVTCDVMLRVAAAPLLQCGKESSKDGAVLHTGSAAWRRPLPQNIGVTIRAHARI